MPAGWVALYGPGAWFCTDTNLVSKGWGEWNGAQRLLPPEDTDKCGVENGRCSTGKLMP